MNGQEVAVKSLSSSTTQGMKESENEVILIANLWHQNLVKLLAYREMSGCLSMSACPIEV